MLVLAGAGTGKTRVLTTRIAHILCTGRARGSEILAVTFTNKAAREMKARIGALVGGAVEGMPWLGTFHAIGVKILRRHAELVGLKSSFTILDTDDQIRLIKQVIESEGLDKDRWPARQLAALIDSWKNRGLTPDKVPRGEAFAFAEGKGAALYAAYQKRLKELNATDFGDLLLEVLRLFQQNPDVLTQYRGRFRYTLVDEYQDTNVAQYLLLRLIAAGSPNICCVGDDDQSIYGWRGAEVDNILRFEQDFPGAKVIRLERNYRSTGHILAAASGLIAHNKGRLGKTLFTDDDMGNRVGVFGVWDDEEEARTIGDDIEALRKAGRSLDDIAILVRASFQMRAFEDRFVTLGLPYRVVGGPRFYERQEIKDAIAYLEVTLNPANDLKFERIVNVPKRGLGDTAVKRVTELGRARGISLYQAAREIVETEELTGRARKSLADLLTAFERWRGRIEGMKHTELAELILDESGYTQMWQNDKSPQAHSRLENLKELIRFMHEFETLEGFIEHVSLVMDVDTADGGDRVSLMTLARRQGPGVRGGVPARLGGGPVPAPEEPRRKRQRGPRGGAPPRPRRPHARAAPGQGQLRPEPAQPRALSGRRALALRRRAARAQRRGDRGQEPLWRFGGRRHGWRRPVQPLRPQPLRRARSRLCQRLFHARLATRQGAHEPRGGAALEGTDDHRWGSRRLVDRQRLRLRHRRARVPPEVRLRADRRGRRQQAHHRFRQGRPQARGGQLRGAGGGLIGARRFLPAHLREQEPLAVPVLSALYASLLRFT